MSLLNNMKSDNSIKGETDSVGMGGPKESGLYPVTVGMAYLQQSAGGAVGLNLTLKPTDGSAEIRQTLWIASGNAKGNKNYYEKDGERFHLPGFNHANSLALLTLGKEIGDVDTEEKIVNIYSRDAGAEVPTKVEVLMELLDQEILVGLQKQTVDRRQRQDDGSYQPTGETIDVNEIDKFFRASDSMTLAEDRDPDTTQAQFVHTWAKKWEGVTRNRATGATGNQGSAGAPANPAAQGGANNSQRSGLFPGAQ